MRNNYGHWSADKCIKFSTDSFFSLWRLIFFVYVVVNIKMASAKGFLDLVFDEVNFKPDYSPDFDDEKNPYQ